MPWSVTIGRFGGTAVRIHFTLILFLVWIGVSAWQRQGAAAAGSSLIFIVLLFACVVLHEFGHIIAARRYGIETPEVTLLPIGGVASMKRLPTDPRQEFIVALAGPAVNLVIGAALALAIGAFRPEQLGNIDDPDLSLAARLAAANLFLAVFNLIPAFPMDGGRILHAALSARMGAAKATAIAARVGQALAIGLGLLGLAGNPMLLFIAVFIYIAATGEAEMTALNQAMGGLTVADVMETRFATLHADAKYAETVEAMMSTAQSDFPLVDGYGKPMGVLSRADILAALERAAETDPAASLLRAPAECVGRRTTMEDAFERLQTTHVSSICVVDADGVLVGLLPVQTLAEVMRIRAARPNWRFRGAA